MTHAAYVLTGWGVVAGSVALFTWRTLRRGRTLSRLVPEERRRWG
ncbi:MAG TPA: hypothetical protein VGA13_08755 [Acidimicrobiales bacterium]|jgi:hypothetical protein